MKQKTKKQVKTVLVVLFFLVAGVWYVYYIGGFEKQESQTKLAGILAEGKTKVTIMPETVQTIVPSEIPVQTEEVVVYLCGAVNEPGIYTLPGGSRLYEALALAGGFSAEADPAYHNLARDIADGERIYILSFEETKALTTEQAVQGEAGGQTASQGENSKIDLNTATAEQLMELPGIGEAKAAGILEYRKRVGRFTDIEEIMNVSGIGEAMFEKIKDKVTVR